MSKVNLVNYDEDTNDQFDEDFPWDEPEVAIGYEGPGPMVKRNNRDFRNSRYNNAFGNYRGGYGRGGGFPGPRGFPPGPMAQNYPPPLMWGEGFGPRGPPPRRSHKADRAMKYLLRCGVAKEHLKNVPRDLLALIDPEYCGLCGSTLESYATSRMHYLSKNHMKNHKRWLSQYSEGGFPQNREVPLKSRDLYCELCDVHITSKMHADTHYAGKPHRSVVEGRKNPKNPMLLQNESRLEQLIRREKRFLKPEEPAPVVEKPKQLKSDLFCDICKTSMTCSEQMTMHLNGKRHLTKEKQHILKMMKLKTDKNEDETSTEVIKEEGAEIKQENEECVPEEPQEQQGADNDDDWGTEQWETEEKETGE